jgi:CRP-like cAMP-binding protein
VSGSAAELSAAREALASQALLGRLPAAELERLAALAEPFALERGEVVFHEGQMADQVYLLAEGRMEATLPLPGGVDLEVESIGPGGLLGEMAVLARLPRQVSARALEPSSGWAIAAQRIGELAGLPEAAEVGRRLGRIAVERLRRQYERLAAHVADDPRTAASARPSSLDLAGPVVVLDAEPDEVDYLATILFFSAFARDDLEELVAGLRRLEAPRGADLVLPDERPPALLAVLRGAAETTIRRGGAAGRARLAGPGRLVGHLGVLDSEPSPVSCRARERTILLELPRERVLELVTSTDHLGRTFARGVYADVVDALAQAQRPISRMAATGG